MLAPTDVCVVVDVTDDVCEVVDSTEDVGDVDDWLEVADVVVGDVVVVVIEVVGVVRVDKIPPPQTQQAIWPSTPSLAKDLADSHQFIRP